MSRYAAGFLTATMVWLAVGSSAWFVWLRPPEVIVIASAPEPTVEEVSADPEKAPRSRRRRQRGGSRSRRGNPHRNLDRVETRGDDLGGTEPRNLDLTGGSGGEAQLTGAQIEAGMDGAMRSIRRCLVLATGDEPIRGRLVFGLRVSPSGRVARVNLRGPRAVTRGECGECLERAARRAHFPAFDGQDMVVHYPLTLE